MTKVNHLSRDCRTLLVIKCHHVRVKGFRAAIATAGATRLRTVLFRAFSAQNCEKRTIWIVDAHGDGKRFIVRADELLTAFVELERAIHEFAVSLLS